MNKLGDFIENWDKHQQSTQNSVFKKQPIRKIKQIVRLDSDLSKTVKEDTAFALADLCEMLLIDLTSRVIDRVCVSKGGKIIRGGDFEQVVREDEIFDFLIDFISHSE